MHDSQQKIRWMKLVPGQSNLHKSEIWMAVMSRQQEAADLARPEDIYNQIAIVNNI